MRAGAMDGFDELPTANSMLAYYDDDIDASPPRPAPHPVVRRSPGASRHGNMTQRTSSTGVSQAMRTTPPRHAPQAADGYEEHAHGHYHRGPASHAPTAQSSVQDIPAYSAAQFHEHPPHFAHHDGPHAGHHHADPHPANSVGGSTDALNRTQPFEREENRAPSRTPPREVEIRHLTDELNAERKAHNDTRGELERLRSELAEVKAGKERAQADAARLKTDLEQQRTHHAEELERVGKERSSAATDVIAARRELEVKVASLETDLEIANAKLRATAHALEAERREAADMADRMARQWQSQVASVPSLPTATMRAAPTAAPGTPPHRSPARPVEHRVVAKVTATSPQAERAAAATPRNSGVSTPRLEQPADSPARHAIRDKNATVATTDTNEVEQLEDRLCTLSAQRDAADEQLRRIEHTRIRSLAEKARRDTLTREVAELNASVSNVRRRLRELSALAR